MQSAHLDATFAALADPTRRAILVRLARGEASVNELAKPFAISLPAISRHLKVLEHARLITRARDAQWRPCKLSPAPLDEVTAWLASQRREWEQRFDRLDAYVQTLTTTPTKPTTSTKPKETRRGKRNRK